MSLEDALRQYWDLPTRQLKVQIIELQDEINLRNKILETSMGRIYTQILRLKDKVQRLRYHAKKHVEGEIERLKKRQVDEFISWFRDYSRLREQLLNVKQQLEKQEIKALLIKV